MKKIFILIISIIMLCSFSVGCDKCNPADPNNGEQTEEYIYLNFTEATLDVGEKLNLSIETNIKDLSGCVWESSDTAVASVSDNGTISSVGEGSSVITCKIGEVSATCRVTVYNSYSYPYIFVNDTNLRLVTGQNYTIDAKVIYKSQETNAVIEFISENENIAQVSENGVITAKKVGLVKIIINAQYEDISLQQAINVAVLTDNLF